jgi:hypothetical protein
MGYKKICIVCKKVIDGYGHNALPYRNGIACDKCNIDKVLPYRFKLANGMVHH